MSADRAARLAAIRDAKKLEATERVIWCVECKRILKYTDDDWSWLDSACTVAECDEHFDTRFAREYPQAWKDIP